MFECNKCGACCSNLNLNSLYKELDRGDGYCTYYNINTKLCNIYDSRPSICRIDEMYEKYFKTLMSKDDYYKQNNEACKKLMKLNRG